MKNNELSRIVIELPKTQHRKLKARAATLGKSMKELFLEALEATDIALKQPIVKKAKTTTKVKPKKKMIFKALKIKTKGFKFNREDIYDE